MPYHWFRSTSSDPVTQRELRSRRVEHTKKSSELDATANSEHGVNVPDDIAAHTLTYATPWKSKPTNPSLQARWPGKNIYLVQRSLVCPRRTLLVEDRLRRGVGEESVESLPLLVADPNELPPRCSKSLHRADLRFSLLLHPFAVDVDGAILPLRGDVEQAG